jgi:hypothetical protein
MTLPDLLHIDRDDVAVTIAAAVCGDYIKHAIGRHGKAAGLGTSVIGDKV